MGVIGTLKNRIGVMQMQAMLARVARENAAFDANYGTETAQEVPLTDYDIPEAERGGLQQYSSVHEGVVRSMLSPLGTLLAGYEFVDIGSGKGKALLVASLFPFRRVLGIELSPALHAIAEDNIAAFAAKAPVACRDVASQCADARQFHDFGARTYVFIFNPFGEEIMADVVRNLEQAVAGGAALVIGYLSPRARRPLDASRSWERIVDSNRVLLYATPGVDLDRQACEELTRKFNGWRI